MRQDFRPLAKLLIEYSVELQKDENILIETVGSDTELTIALLEEAYSVGAKPFVLLKNPQITRAIVKDASIEQLKLSGEAEAFLMRRMSAYVGIRAADNIFEMGGLPQKQMNNYSTHWSNPVHSQIRVPQTKWVVLRYPNPAMAQLAGMSTEDFYDYYMKVCTLDYAKLSAAMQPLQALMAKTDKVRLEGPNLDLRFSIAGIDAICCDGHRNIPDGEVYTAPVRDSIEGTITYNTPSVYNGINFSGVSFKFVKGRIKEAYADTNSDKLNEILDIDEGGRYIGEFSLGFNPHIDKPIMDILFDEKIRGSFHLTPGQCYDEASNGNNSAIHWDLVNRQDKSDGGGNVYFDGKLIRRDGRFVLPELEALNPENYL